MANANRFRLKIRTDQFKIPSKALRPQTDSAPRVGAEIALILGGNREGVLEAFTIHAIPGYNFQLISARYSTEEIKKWLTEDNREASIATGEDQEQNKPGHKGHKLSVKGMQNGFRKAIPKIVRARS